MPSILAATFPGEHPAPVRVRMVVENVETGERYIQTSKSLWAAELAHWRASLDARDARLRAAFARANKRGEWALYRRAVRAANRRYGPCPMPEGHMMFKNAANSARYRILSA